MKTTRDHVKALAKNVVSRLEQDEAILLNPRTRQMVYQDLYLKLESMILTDDQIREKVIAQLGLKSEALNDTGLAESDQFKAAKSVLMNRFGENAIRGLYYQRAVKNVAEEIGLFLMNHHQVEDVFLTDEEMEKSIVEFLKRFDPENLH